MNINITEQELKIVIQCLKENIELIHKDGKNYCFTINGKTYVDFLIDLKSKLQILHNVEQIEKILNDI